MRSDTPHARLAHKDWRDDRVRQFFRAAWSTYIEACRPKQRSRSEWAEPTNQRNWEIILQYRLFDAFGIRQAHLVPPAVRAAFEAILFTDVRGESLPVAYAYALEAIDTGLVPGATRAYALVGTIPGDSAL